MFFVVLYKIKTLFFRGMYCAIWSLPIPPHTHLRSIFTQRSQTLKAFYPFLNAIFSSFLSPFSLSSNTYSPVGSHHPPPPTTLLFCIIYIPAFLTSLKPRGFNAVATVWWCFTKEKYGFSWNNAIFNYNIVVYLHIRHLFSSTSQ